jgi:hypothetical protein
MSNMTVVNNETREVVLMGLEEFVDYNISVRAFTNVGVGPYSVGIVEMTNKDGEFHLHLLVDYDFLLTIF